MVVGYLWQVVLLTWYHYSAGMISVDRCKRSRQQIPRWVFWLTPLEVACPLWFKTPWLHGLELSNVADRYVCKVVGFVVYTRESTCKHFTVQPSPVCLTVFFFFFFWYTHMLLGDRSTKNPWMSQYITTVLVKVEVILQQSNRCQIWT